MVVLRLSGSVWLPQMEQALEESGIHFLATVDGWAPAGGELVSTFTLDLEGLTFVHVAALAALPVIAKAACTDDAVITVIAPRNDAAKSFIASVALVDALRSVPGRRFKVLAAEDLATPRTYARLFALQWLTISDTPRVQSWLANTLSVGIGPRRSTLPWASAAELTRLILDELIDNVGTHSGEIAALVVVWAQDAEQMASSTRYYVSERNAFRSMRATSWASIHIAVADGGRGLERALGPSYPKYEGSRLLGYAFDRWSSSVDDSVDRGTRGLYRVARLAGHQFGFATIRSGEHSATQSVRDASDTGRPAEATYTQTFPGSLIRVELPLSLPRRPILGPPSGHVESIALVKAQGPMDLTRARLKSRLSSLARPGTITVLDLGTVEIPSPSMGGLLRDIAEVSHPGPVAILGWRTSNTALESKANDENQRFASLDAQSARLAESYEPVLTVGTDFTRAYWAVTDPTLAQRLEARAIHDQESIARLAGSSNLLQPREDGTWVRRLTSRSLADSARAHAGDRIKAYLRRPRPGSYFVSSSLTPVNGWVDVQALLRQHPEEHGLLARILLTEVALGSSSLMEREPGLVYEATMDGAFATTVAELLNGAVADRANAQPVGAHDLDVARPLRLPPDRPVVVLVQATSEEQTARNLIAYALRQNYEVLAVLTVVDARPSQASVRLWGKDYPVFSVASIPLRVNEPTGTAQRTPSAKRSVELPKLPTRTTELIAHLDKSGALHLGHFIAGRGRHFTFFLDAERLLNDSASRQFLMHAAAASLASIRKNRVVVVAAHEDRPDEPALKFARAVMADFGLGRAPIKELKLTARAAKRYEQEGTVLYVAWGSLSGNTLFRAIDSIVAKGARRVQVLVAFSQLEPDAELHLTQLMQMKGPEGPCAITVTFLGRLPLAAHPHETCPVCQQPSSSGTLLNSAQSRIEWERERARLAVKPWHEHIRSPARDVIEQQYGPGSVRLVGEALMRRYELDSAARDSLEARLWLHRWVDQFSNEKFLLSVATLLVYEPNWLRRSPLTNAGLRNTLAGSLVDYLEPAQGTIREDGDIARALIALRLASKSTFVETLPRLVRAVHQNPTLFSLLAHLVQSMSTRSYINETNFPRQLTAGLLAAIEESDQERREENVALTLRQISTQLDESNPLHYLRQETLDNLARRLKDVTIRFAQHHIRDYFSATSVASTQEDGQKAARAWNELVRWLRSNVLDLVTLLRPWLMLSREFYNDPDFLALFPGPSTLGVVVSAESVIAAAVREQKPLSAADIEVVENSRRVLKSIFHQRPSDGETPDQPSRLDTAIDTCEFSLGVLCDEFRRAVEGEFELDEPDFSFPHAIWLPSWYLDQLFTAVLSNTIRSRTDVTRFRIEVRPGESDLATIVNFVSTSVHHKARPRTKRGKGALRELNEISIQAGIKISHFRHGDDYVVQVQAKGSLT